VGDQEQVPTRRDRRPRPAQRGAALGGLQLQVGHDGEVDLGQVVGERVTDDPVDLEAGLGRGLAAPLDAAGGEVQGRDVPAAAGQPDRVAPLAAGEVEGPAG
jgi:hypothetical protein